MPGPKPKLSFQQLDAVIDKKAVAVKRDLDGLMPSYTPSFFACVKMADMDTLIHLYVP